MKPKALDPASLFGHSSPGRAVRGDHAAPEAASGQ